VVVIELFHKETSVPTLTVEKFSCIESASLELRPVTILIGPQASGKSVLTKLFYFFAGLLSSQYTSAENGMSLKAYEKKVARDFAELFPPSAWGRKQFVIEYTAGKFRCKISRRATARKIYDETLVEFSAFFKTGYDVLVSEYREATKATKKQDEFSTHRFNLGWRVQSNSYKRLMKNLGEEFISSQYFVPAGRSFFTNLGKAIAMLEHGSQLDELTKRFGRVFTTLLDGENFYYYGDKPPQRIRDFIKSQDTETANIFGGDIKLSRNDRHVATFDGRKIPFSVLSSGQQELLPLILFIRHFTRMVISDRDKTSDLLYIEEPEAHLFPSAQDALTAHLAAVSNFTAPSGHMFITTHSPYVLAKLNTLIKAFLVATLNDGDKKAVEKVIPRAQWLAPARVAAYALQSGKLAPIKDESGLIDGEYLDSISSDISADFMALLGIESGHD